jgi:UDP-2,3-diacylglucosamine pyrophosphatase LpxH
VFISDVHLGNRFARAESLLSFLNRCEPDHLFLVGDFIDGWCLSRKWHWPKVYDAVIRRLLALAKNGTQIVYTPGNHDDFLRNFQFDQTVVRIEDEFIHRCADGRQLLVLHGDQFDNVERSNRWLSKIGSVAYEILLFFDRGINGVLGKFTSIRFPISRLLKQSVKRIVQWISGFESKVAERAKSRGCDGAVCGHIHVAKQIDLQGIHYINLGDWIENCTAMVEYTDGRLELLDLKGQLETGDGGNRQAACERVRESAGAREETAEAGWATVLSRFAPAPQADRQA